MAPPCRPRRTTLPALMEELVEEILVRMPPDEPAHLLRAALVCKLWRRIVSDPGFLSRFRAFQRHRLPLLGFFYNDWSRRGRGGSIARFKPAAAAFPSLPPDYRRRTWCVLDCRHGRVLLRDLFSQNILVWDPISDAWQEVQVHDIDRDKYCFSVLCAVAGCDHHDCRGGPFLVVYLGAVATNTNGTVFRALVYSSEARAWGAPVSSSQFDGVVCLDIHNGRAADIGDEIYYIFSPGFNIVKYDLVKRCISVFSSPSISSDEVSHNSPAIVGEDSVLTQNDDGSLGLASIWNTRLYLWSSRMVNHDEKFVAEWVQERVIELGKVLPMTMNKLRAEVCLSGFAEGAGIIFISTYVHTFTLELRSGRVRKITSSTHFAVFPFISFLTPSEAIGRAATSAEPALKKIVRSAPKKGANTLKKYAKEKEKAGATEVPEHAPVQFASGTSEARSKRVARANPKYSGPEWV